MKVSYRVSLYPQKSEAVGPNLEGMIKVIRTADKTSEAYKRAVLAILEKTSELAEEVITPKSIDLVANQGITPVRAAIFNVFERTRRLLGRDSEAVILEDASEYFRRLAKEVDLSTANTGRGRYASNPFDWVNEKIVGLLDPDVRMMVAPVSDGDHGWIVPHTRPYFHLQKRLYERLFGRSARAK
jgi:hypothetical protein